MAYDNGIDALQASDICYTLDSIQQRRIDDSSGRAKGMSYYDLECTRCPVMRMNPGRGPLCLSAGLGWGQPSGTLYNNQNSVYETISITPSATFTPDKALHLEAVSRQQWAAGSTVTAPGKQPSAVTHSTATVTLLESISPLCKMSTSKEYNMQSGVSAADPFFGISALSIQQQEANGAVLVTRTISSSTQRTNTSTAPKRFPHSRTIATGSPHSSSPGKGYARRHAAATAAKAVHRTPSNATVNTCRTCSSNSGTTLGGTRVGGAACQHADNDQDHDHEAHAISTATTTQSALLGDGCALSSAGSADPALDADHLNHLHAILDGTATAQSVDAPLAALDSAAITGTAVTNQVSTAAGGTQQQQQPIPPSSAVVSQLQLQSLQQQPQLVQAQDSPGRSLSAVSAGPCPYGHLPPHMREAAIAAAAKAAASGDPATGPRHRATHSMGSSSTSQWKICSESDLSALMAEHACHSDNACSNNPIAGAASHTNAGSLPVAGAAGRDSPQQRTLHKRMCASQAAARSGTSGWSGVTHGSLPSLHGAHADGHPMHALPPISVLRQSLGAGAGITIGCSSVNLNDGLGMAAFASGGSMSNNGSTTHALANPPLAAVGAARRPQTYAELQSKLHQAQLLSNSLEKLRAASAMADQHETVACRSFAAGAMARLPRLHSRRCTADSTQAPGGGPSASADARGSMGGDDVYSAVGSNAKTPSSPAFECVLETSTSQGSGRETYSHSTAADAHALHGYSPVRALLRGVEDDGSRALAAGCAGTAAGSTGDFGVDAAAPIPELTHGSVRAAAAKGQKRRGSWLIACFGGFCRVQETDLPSSVPAAVASPPAFMAGPQAAAVAHGGGIATTAEAAESSIVWPSPAAVLAAPCDAHAQAGSAAGPAVEKAASSAATASKPAKPAPWPAPPQRAVVTVLSPDKATAASSAPSAPAPELPLQQSPELPIRQTPSQDQDLVLLEAPAGLESGSQATACGCERASASAVAAEHGQVHHGAVGATDGRIPEASPTRKRVRAYAGTPLASLDCGKLAAMPLDQMLSALCSALGPAAETEPETAGGVAAVAAGGLGVHQPAGHGAADPWVAATGAGKGVAGAELFLHTAEGATMRAATYSASGITPRQPKKKKARKSANGPAASAGMVVGYQAPTRLSASLDFGQAGMAGMRTSGALGKGRVGVTGGAIVSRSVTLPASANGGGAARISATPSRKVALALCAAKQELCAIRLARVQADSGPMSKGTSNNRQEVAIKLSQPAKPHPWRGSSPKPADLVKGRAVPAPATLCAKARPKAATSTSMGLSLGAAAAANSTSVAFSSRILSAPRGVTSGSRSVRYQELAVGSSSAAVPITIHATVAAVSKVPPMGVNTCARLFVHLLEEASQGAGTTNEHAANNDISVQVPGQEDRTPQAAAAAPVSTNATRPTCQGSSVLHMSAKASKEPVRSSFDLSSLKPLLKEGVLSALGAPLISSPIIARGGPALNLDAEHSLAHMVAKSTVAPRSGLPKTGEKQSAATVEQLPAAAFNPAALVESAVDISQLLVQLQAAAGVQAADRDGSKAGKPAIGGSETILMTDFGALTGDSVVILTKSQGRVQSGAPVCGVDLAPGLKAMHVSTAADANVEHADVEHDECAEEAHLQQLLEASYASPDTLLMAASASSSPGSTPRAATAATHMQDIARPRVDPASWQLHGPTSMVSVTGPGGMHVPSPGANALHVRHAVPRPRTAASAAPPRSISPAGLPESPRTSSGYSAVSYITSSIRPRPSTADPSCLSPQSPGYGSVGTGAGSGGIGAPVMGGVGNGGGGSYFASFASRAGTSAPKPPVPHYALPLARSPSAVAAIATATSGPGAFAVLAQTSALPHAIPEDQAQSAFVDGVEGYGSSVLAAAQAMWGSASGSGRQPGLHLAMGPPSQTVSSGGTAAGAAGYVHMVGGDGSSAGAAACHATSSQRRSASVGGGCARSAIGPAVSSLAGGGYSPTGAALCSSAGSYAKLAEKRVGSRCGAAAGGSTQSGAPTMHPDTGAVLGADHEVMDAGDLVDVIAIPDSTSTSDSGSGSCCVDSRVPALAVYAAAAAGLEDSTTVPSEGSVNPAPLAPQAAVVPRLMVSVPVSMPCLDRASSCSGTNTHSTCRVSVGMSASSDGANEDEGKGKKHLDLQQWVDAISARSSQLLLHLPAVPTDRHSAGGSGSIADGGAAGGDVKLVIEVLGSMDAEGCGQLKVQIEAARRSSGQAARVDSNGARFSAADDAAEAQELAVIAALGGATSTKPGSSSGSLQIGSSGNTGMRTPPRRSLLLSPCARTPLPPTPARTGNNIEELEGTIPHYQRYLQVEAEVLGEVLGSTSRSSTSSTRSAAAAAGGSSSKSVQVAMEHATAVLEAGKAENSTSLPPSTEAVPDSGGDGADDDGSAGVMFGSGSAAHAAGATSKVGMQYSATPSANSSGHGFVYVTGSVSVGVRAPMVELELEATYTNGDLGQDGDAACADGGDEACSDDGAPCVCEEVSTMPEACMHAAEIMNPDRAALVAGAIQGEEVDGAGERVGFGGMEGEEVGEGGGIELRSVVPALGSRSRLQVLKLNHH